MKVSKKVPIIVYSVLGGLVLVLLLVLLGVSLHFPGDSSVADEPFVNQSGDSSRRITWDDDYNVSIEGSIEELFGDNRIYWLPYAGKYEIDTAASETRIQPTKGEPMIQVESEFPIKVYIKDDGDECRISFDVKWRFPDEWKAPRITIYLPQQELQSFDVEAAAGTLAVSGIQAREAELKVSAGQVTVSECAFEEVDIEVKAGQLTYYADQDIRSIESNVSAGEIELYLSNKIPGFSLEYEVTVGDFQDNTGFPLSGSAENKDFVRRTGSFRYGDSPDGCRIELKTTGGSTQLYSY